MTASASSPRVALVSGWEIARDGVDWRAIDAPLPVAARPPGRPTLVRADLGLEVSARPLGDAAGTVRVTLRTRAAARGVHFDAPGWRAAHEHFALAPGTSVDVDLRPVAQPAPAWHARVGAINAAVWTSVAAGEGA